MWNIINLENEARKSLDRLLPSITASLGHIAKEDAQGWQVFLDRLNHHFNNLFELYYDLYHQRYDFFYHLEDLLICIARACLERPIELRKLDNTRENDPHWFQHHQMLGAVCYVDLFAGDI